MAAAEEGAFRGQLEQPTAKSLRDIYSDPKYRFAGHAYGDQGEDGEPGFFVFSKTAQRWMRITEVTTRGAVLGRSPNPAKVRLPVGWDHSRLKEQEYVKFPLVESSVMLPDKIEYDSENERYRLILGSRFGAASHPTIFVLPKAELDSAF